MKLYDFQERAVEFHLAHHYSLNCSEMGTGKSLTALEVSKRTGLKAAVIGPPFLRGTWEVEAEKAGVDVTYFPYTMLDRDAGHNLKDYKLWICDEAHYLKTPTTIRTAAFYKLLLKYPPEYLIGLTGTPIKNRVPDFWTLIGFCGTNPKGTSGKVLDGNLKKYRGFCYHFCEVEKAFIGRGKTVDKFTVLRDDRVDEFKSYLKDKMIRFRVEDVLKDLPSITRKVVNLDLEETPGLEAEFKAYMLGHKTNVTGKCANALLKAPLTANYCNEIQAETGEPLLIFSDHVAATKKIGEMLKSRRVKVVTGATSPKERAEIVDNFQKGALSAIVATIGALSVGVTLTAAKHVVFSDMSWVPADNLQAEKRIHRIGQRMACFSHFIVSSPTDGYIQKTLVSKLDTINKVLE